MNTIYRVLCEHKCSFPWDKCQNMQLLGHMVHIYFCKKKNLVFLHSCKDFFIISYSDIHIMNAIVVLTCITLRANEHLLMCLFVIFISSSVKCLVMSFAHFLIGLFCLWDWLTVEFREHLYSDTNHLLICQLKFHPALSLLFILLKGTFAREKTFCFLSFHEV